MSGLEDKVIRLPDLDAMRTLLSGINNHSHLRECFYPRLIACAGKEMPAYEFIGVFCSAVRSYQNSSRGGVSNRILNFPFLKIDLFVDAFVEEESVAFEIKENLNDRLLF